MNLTAHIDETEFFRDFNNVYDMFYDSADSVAIQEKVNMYCELFDVNMSYDNFASFVRDMAIKRGDMFTSDRECAAFMVVFNHYIVNTLQKGRK